MTDTESTAQSYNDFVKGYTYGTHTLKNKPLVGFKKVYCTTKNNPILISANENASIKDEEIREQCIAKVEVPVGATVIRPFIKDDYGTIHPSNKVRTNKYKVLEITPLQKVSPSGQRVVVDASSIHDNLFKYREGLTYTVKMDERENVQCTNGLHFFLDRQHAEKYMT